MKECDFDKVWLGIVYGLIIPPVIYSVYFLLVTQYDIKRINVSLCMVANLLPFYLTLNKEKYKATKGVLIGTFIWAGIIAYFSLFTDHLHIL